MMVEERSENVPVSWSERSKKKFVFVMVKSLVPNHKFGSILVLVC